MDNDALLNKKSVLSIPPLSLNFALPLSPNFAPPLSPNFVSRHVANHEEDVKQMTLCRQFRMALLRGVSIDMIWGSPPSQDAFTQPSRQVDRFGGNEALTFQALWSGPFFFA